MKETILKIQDLRVYYPVKTGVWSRIKSYIKAVDDVSFEVFKGESYGLVGESGSGKTTFGRSILNLIKPLSGKIYYQNKPVDMNNKSELDNIRKKIQIVFQDPFSSLNPRKTVGSILIEPLVFHKILKRSDAIDKAVQFLQAVGLTKNDFYKYPHEFSGGQRQRIGIARSLILEPELIILDEPVSSLDVSVQAQILNLLKDLQKQYNLTYIFIAHNLNVVRFFCDRISVMYLGQIMESASTEELFNNPCHPYTRLLLDSIPEINKKKSLNRFDLLSETPSLLSIDEHCRFYKRCSEKISSCSGSAPALEEKDPDHFCRCYAL